MKKILFILLLMIGIAIAYFPFKEQIPIDADNYLKEDSIQNRNLAMRQLDSVFNGRKIVTPLYHNFNPKYELLSSAQKSKIDNKNELYQLYKFRPDHLTNWESPLHVLGADIRIENSQRGKEWYEPLHGGNFYGIWQSGWALGCAKMISGDKYICYMVIPYMVGYNRQNDSFYYEFKPTIREALNTAYDFYTKNEQSEFVNFISRDNMKKFMTLSNELSLIINARNYTFEKVKNEKSDFEFANPGVFEGTNYMYNGYIRVYIGMIYHTTYQLKYNKEFASWDKESYIEQHEQKLQRYLIMIESVLGFLLFLFATFYIISRRKTKETILDKLIKATNPKRFMKQYNQKTIDVANRIYSLAKDCKPDDSETIEKLCTEAEQELKVSFVDKREKKELLNRCNPKRFMKPYDSRKVTKANEIYGKIKQSNLSYSDYVRMKNEVDELYEEKKEESTSLVTEEPTSNKE